MWFGHLTLVWKISGVLGAWAPVLAASLLLYLRAVGDREHQIFVAWLTRAIGMHVVLLWMLGVNDWLAGAPGTVRRWDPDAGAPLVLISFFPVFFLTFACLDGLRRAHTKLSHVFSKPALPKERDRSAPNRGVTFETHQWRPAIAWGVPTVLALGGAIASVMHPSNRLWIVASVALVASLQILARPAQLMASVLALAASVAIATTATLYDHAMNPMIALALAPWLLVGAVAILALVTGLSVRLRTSSRALATR
jgi:hypothetical protein